MRELSLKESQRVQLELLDFVNQTTEKLKIRYWLMYGSLLGAVRHKGFIPWDDDIDIAMRREDYDIFEAHLLSHPELYAPIVLQTYKTVEGYPYYIPRLSDERYCVKINNKAYHTGLFLDIYPFDGMGNDKSYWYEMFPKLYRTRKRLSLSTNVSLLYGRNIFNKLLNIPNALYSKRKGWLFFLEQLDQIERQFTWDESKYVSIPVWDPEVWFFRKEWFAKIDKVPYENTYAYIPQNYDEILRERYGEYMKLPPESERVPHHNYTAYEKM